MATSTRSQRNPTIRHHNQDHAHRDHGHQDPGQHHRDRTIQITYICPGCRSISNTLSTTSKPPTTIRTKRPATATSPPASTAYKCPTDARKSCATPPTGRPDFTRMSATRASRSTHRVRAGDRVTNTKRTTKNYDAFFSLVISYTILHHHHHTTNNNNKNHNKNSNINNNQTTEEGNKNRWQHQRRELSALNLPEDLPGTFAALELNIEHFFCFSSLSFSSSVLNPYYYYFFILNLVK